VSRLIETFDSYFYDKNMSKTANWLFRSRSDPKRILGPLGNLFSILMTSSVYD
jgi:hypothetical protein